jgi:succinoglycan biosynthesis protein ExoA
MIIENRKSGLVSIIVPCYNEENSIVELLEAIIKQTYPRESIEVIIADGLSTDRTRDVIQDFSSQHPAMTLRLIDNPTRTIPAGLNLAIQAAKGEIIVRLDAHSKPYPDYVQRCVASLNESKGDNVGGLWEILPRNDSWQAGAIASAAAHPLAVGDARYRYSHQAGYVETVPFGAFHRSLIDKVGAFDESLLTNEDYEFNTRINRAGGKIWFDPKIRSVYYARANLVELARQYWRYGYWKAKMLRRYPETIRWRQALPPAFVLSLLVFLFSSIWLSFARWLIMLELLSYVTVLFLIGIQSAYKYKQLSYLIGVPLAIVCMHLSWGSAFLWSLLKS